MTPPLPNLTPIQQQISQWAQSVPGLLAQTPAQVVAAYQPTVAYQTYWLTAKTIYDQTAAIYNDGYVRGAEILATFQAMATQRPASDFYAQITTPGSQGLDIGSPQAQAFLASLVDPNGSYVPANPNANPPTAAVTSIAQGKLLTPQEAQVLGSLGTTVTYPIPGVTSIAASDVSAVQAAVTQFNAAQALVQAVQSGQSAALGPINAYQNGPANGTPPTDLQIVQAFAAGAFPGKTFTVTGG